MIHHAVMFHLKDECTTDDLEAVRQGLLALPVALPNLVVEYRVGLDLKLTSGQTHPSGPNRHIFWTCSFRSIDD